MPPAVREIARLLTHASRTRDTYSVFADTCEMMAITMSRMDLRQAEAREVRFLQLEQCNGREFRDMAAAVFAKLVEALEAEPFDVLGAVFHELELHNKHAGQFFTPYHLCRLMASVSGNAEEWRGHIERRGYMTMCEPAAGSGAMVIALADEMRRAGINYQRHLHVTAVDVDSRAAHMAFVQLGLLHIPAVVVVGNTLTLEERERWLTPAHVMGGWSWRLAVAVDQCTSPEIVQSVPAHSACDDQPRPTARHEQIALF